jgi:hypothetical protein
MRSTAEGDNETGFVCKTAVQPKTRADLACGANYVHIVSPVAAPPRLCGVPLADFVKRMMSLLVLFALWFSVAVGESS